ncbi:MAG: DUF4136 domain-containing protein [Rhizobacter sp.]|nr:DUF4136 domain-containing protein [Rhizobacter sp.]
MYRLLTIAIAGALLSGCAAMRNLSSEVSSYGQWPADRKPGSYAFERLPSQQSQPEQQQRLEDAARAAIEAAGFTPAADAQSADVSIQLGARITQNARSPFDDPFWWGGGIHYARPWRPYWRTGIGLHYSTPSYGREVALLVRDRKSGQPLYEARATNDGASPSINSLLSAMYEAAMKDFPNGGINPRTVTVELRN